MKPLAFDAYKNKFPHVKLERSEDGILLVQLHNGSGGEFEWSFENHHEIAYLWRDIGDDQDNKVIILTGSGDAFLRREYLNVEDIDRENMDDPKARAIEWIDTLRHGRRIEMELLDIDQPMIAALNGPCSIHAEIPLLCDVVLAAEHTILADAVHYDFGLVPGDGVQAIFPMLMGLNRARYFMITGQQIPAQECKDLGLFNEVLPRDQVLPRAYELARQILTAPAMTRKLFRPILLQQVKEAMLKSVSHGLMAEGLAFAAHIPEKPIRVPATPYDKK